jgi:phytoene dehydrogenase-like protein
LLRPFFAGVVLEEEMTTSRRFVDLMVRMFVLGRAAVPARGMQQIPEQLAARIPAGRLHLGTAARAVAVDRVDSDDGAWATSAVVLATDADTAARLLPSTGAPPPWKGVTTVFHAVAEPPAGHATLRLDADRSPVSNTVVLSNAAAEYAPEGSALVATSMVHRAGQAPLDEPALRRRLAQLWNTDTRDWSLVATRDVPRALPAMRAPHDFRRSVRLPGADGIVYVCGDHRDTSSIQGALVSGRRAADAVLADRAVTEPAVR